MWCILTVTLYGTKEDWLEIQTRLEKFDDITLLFLGISFPLNYFLPKLRNRSGNRSDRVGFTSSPRSDG
jgi:hypothetical protein